MSVDKEVEHADIFLGADAVHPEDLEPDVILPGEDGYEAPAEEAGAGAEAVSPDAEGEQEEKEADAAPEEKEAEAEGTEPEQEEEQQAEQQEEPEVEQQPKSQMIPKARLDKELRARRALEAKIKELEQAQQSEPPAVQEPKTPEAKAPEPEVDVTALEKAFMDGDMSGFSKNLQSLLSSRDTQMRESIRAELLETMQKEVPGQLQQSQQRESFEAVRDELETQYEFLDPNSENFDTALVDTISGFTTSYVNQGYTPGEALQEAAEKVLRVEKPELFKATEATSEKQQQVRKERMNIDKKLQAAKSQPPVVQGGEADNVDPLPDFENMSEAEFDRLTDDQITQYLAKSRANR